MSECAREITWAGGTHTFDLNAPRVRWMLGHGGRAFPGQYGDTPAACLKRFEEQVYSPDDIERVMRIGLMGGGMDEGQAEAVIADHVRGRPLAPNAVLAHAVIVALFVGAADASTSA